MGSSHLTQEEQGRNRTLPTKGLSLSQYQVNTIYYCKAALGAHRVFLVMFVSFWGFQDKQIRGK